MAVNPVSSNDQALADAQRWDELRKRMTTMIRMILQAQTMSGRISFHRLKRREMLSSPAHLVSSLRER